MSYRARSLTLLGLAATLGMFACTDTPIKDGWSAPSPMDGAGASAASGASGMSGGMAGAAGMTGGASGMMAPMLGPLEVMTDKGVVRGALVDGVRVYKGIPYAAPPIGENRFKAPQPAAAWTETLVAENPGAVCPQISPSTRMFAGDENCLFVNVFTPEPAPATPLPVMVWLHGGAYVFGSGSDASYDGKHLVKRGNVVIVTINYRLGALGYLAHEGLAAADASMTSGNYGLLDQRAALEWVKTNIAAFGGDAGNVTIFGESAGGRSVCWHLVAPGSAGLFHRAIVESGLCMKPTYDRAGAEAQGARFATALGCTDPAMAASCLRSKTPQEIVMATQGSATPAPGGIFYQDRSMGFAFEPTIDGVNITGQLPDLLQGAGVSNVPVIQGANTDEGILFHVAVLGNVTPVMTEEEYLAALTTRFGADNAALIAAEYPVADYADPNEAITAVSGDAIFLCPARETAKLLAARTGAATYLYNFGVPLEVNPAIPALAGKVFHSAELPFVWGNEYPLGKVNAEGQPTADALQDYFLQFARTGDPNVMSAPAWPAYAPAEDTLLSFGSTITTVPSLNKEKCDFWTTIETAAQP